MTEQPKQVKFCRDCFFARNKYSQNEESWTCVAPLNQLSEKSLVTGDLISVHTCFQNRYQDQLNPTEICGPEGKWFISNQEYLEKMRKESSSVSGARIPKSFTVDDL